jgi:hypothetical protein
MQFLEVQPSIENYWRALILFGRNVASYKFALGRIASWDPVQRGAAVF